MINKVGDDKSAFLTRYKALMDTTIGQDKVSDLVASSPQKKRFSMTAPKTTTAERLGNISKECLGASEEILTKLVAVVTAFRRQPEAVKEVHQKGIEALIGLVGKERLEEAIQNEKAKEKNEDSAAVISNLYPESKRAKATKKYTELVRNLADLEKYEAGMPAMVSVGELLPRSLTHDLKGTLAAFPALSKLISNAFPNYSISKDSSTHVMGMSHKHNHAALAIGREPNLLWPDTDRSQSNPVDKDSVPAGLKALEPGRYEVTPLKRSLSQEVTRVHLNRGFFDPASGRLFLSEKDTYPTQHAVMSSGSSTHMTASLAGGAGKGSEASAAARRGATEAKFKIEEQLSQAKNIPDVLRAQLEAVLDASKAVGEDQLTSLSLATIINGHLVVTGVGDSEIVIIREGKSLKCSLNAFGNIGEDPDLRDLSCSVTKLQPGDKVVLCSGVSSIDFEALDLPGIVQSKAAIAQKEIEVEAIIDAIEYKLASITEKRKYNLFASEHGDLRQSGFVVMRYDGKPA